MNREPHNDYATALTEELELRDVPPEAVERIVREVRSHTAESGEDPSDSFGSPSRYADEFAPQSVTRRMFVPMMLLAAALGVGAGLLLASGAFGLVDPADQFWGLAPVARLALGGALLVLLVLLVVVLALDSRRRRRLWRP